VRAVYVSYDGAMDPLGASQVVPYVVGLARAGVSMSLVSFEKPDRWSYESARRDLRGALVKAGVHWRPLRYHRRPRLPATAWDLWCARRTIAQEARGEGPLVVHCRGEVAMAAARTARLPAGTRLLHDVRGLFSDERVETGSWPRGGIIDRMVRRVEAANLARADGIVVLTDPARRTLAARRQPLPPLSIIPTSVDLDLFRPPPSGATREYGVAYVGSLGTWYLTDAIVEFSRLAAQQLGARSLFLTPQVEEARQAGVSSSWADVVSVPHSEVPSWLRRCQAMAYFIRPTPAKQASCPTKLGEALATGLPVVTNRGVGGLEPMLLEQRVGVVLDEAESLAYPRALEGLKELLSDPGTATRCRSLATRSFGLAEAIKAYHRLYEQLTEGNE
jgi:glycosyltransferase involved in cell wall biosynthesis